MTTTELFQGALFHYGGDAATYTVSIVNWGQLSALGKVCGEKDILAPIDELQPIPLTADILRDWFGAEIKPMSGTGCRIHHVRVAGRLFSVRLDICQWYLSGASIGKINYVHQLQRLLHALTGQPWPVKIGEVVP